MKQPRQSTVNVTVAEEWCVVLATSNLAASVARLAQVLMDRYGHGLLQARGYRLLAVSTVRGFVFLSFLERLSMTSIYRSRLPETWEIMNSINTYLTPWIL